MSEPSVTAEMPEPDWGLQQAPVARGPGFWRGMMIAGGGILLTLLACALILTGRTPLTPTGELALSLLFILAVMIACFAMVVAAHVWGLWRVGLVVVVLSLVSGLATYLILTGLTALAPSNELVLWVLFFNAVLVAVMVAVLGWQMWQLWRSWKQKVAGARLHVRIVALFSLITALPAILLAGAATASFSRSLDNWFAARTRTIVQNSLAVAQAYIEEHGQVIRSEVANMRRDLDDASEQLKESLEALRQQVIAQATLRDIPYAYVINGEGKILVTALEHQALPFTAPPAAALAMARSGQVMIQLPVEHYRIAALAHLTRYPDAYLYVARPVNPRVINQLRRTQAGVADYELLARMHFGAKLAYGLMYFTISLTFILAAIWIGMWFAGRLVAPIRRLIAGAEQVRLGNLNVTLPIKRGEGDLRRLSATFNKMTTEIKTQRDVLIERKRFMEAVLSGVTAGVIGLDAEGRITLANRSAERLLARAESDLVGRPLGEAVPELGGLLAAESHPALRPRAQEQVTLMIDGTERTFAVQLTREQTGDEHHGMVLTFDDVTDLVVAQRTSAWADVARRIAHEIKNPLTPIQLSAERIRRKYGRAITEDRETFDKLTETIERQAGHIKSMVDEFASFARMPKPEMQLSDVREVVREPVILFRESHGEIEFVYAPPPTPITASLDRRLISQAVTNLVKNATEAIQAVTEGKERPEGYKGRIEIEVRAAEGRVEIEVTDNGVGLPRQNRARLLEPYVTTRAKGTGLGLAIVQKIVEQHAGTLALEDAPVAPGRAKGARVRITLPAPAEKAASRGRGAVADETTKEDGAAEPGAPPPKLRAAAAGS